MMFLLSRWVVQLYNSSKSKSACVHFPRSLLVQKASIQKLLIDNLLFVPLSETQWQPFKRSARYIKKIIHGCLWIWNFSPRVQLEEKFHIYARSCIVLYFLRVTISAVKTLETQISLARTAWRSEKKTLPKARAWEHSMKYFVYILYILKNLKIKRSQCQCLVKNCYPL